MFDQAPSFIFALGRTTPSGVQLLGTAFSLRKAGLLATASHVVGGNDAGLVLLRSRATTLHDYQDTTDLSVQAIPVTLIEMNPFRDVALLKIEGDIRSNLAVTGSDAVRCGNPVTMIGFPHANDGRMVMTRKDTSVGARVLIGSGGVKTKHLIINMQCRPGESGSPVFAQDGSLVAMLIGAYRSQNGGTIIIGDIDPATLHPTSHAVSAEYISEMY